MFPDGYWAGGFYADGFWPEYGLVIVPIEIIALKTPLARTYALSTDLNISINMKTRYVSNHTITTKLRS